MATTTFYGDYDALGMRVLWFYGTLHANTCSGLMYTAGSTAIVEKPHRKVPLEFLTGLVSSLKVRFERLRDGSSCYEFLPPTPFVNDNYHLLAKQG